jgi:hypothetical protein
MKNLQWYHIFALIPVFILGAIILACIVTFIPICFYNLVELIFFKTAFPTLTGMMEQNAGCWLTGVFEIVIFTLVLSFIAGLVVTIYKAIRYLIERI